MSQSPIYDNYEELHKYVLRALVSITKKHPDEVYDCVTDALIKGHEKFHMFDPTKSQLKVWLTNIARNEFLQACRKIRKDPHTFVDFDDQVSQNMYNPIDEPTEDVNPVRDGNVTNTLMSTKWVNANPVRLDAFKKIVAGMSPDDVADDLGIPRTTVRVWVSRAYDEVRATYGVSRDSRNYKTAEVKSTYPEHIKQAIDALESKSFKISARNISLESGLSPQTVQKYWKKR